MDNIFVYLEIEDGVVADVSLELLTKGRSLANQLDANSKLWRLASFGNSRKTGFPYGVDVLHIFSDSAYLLIRRCLMLLFL